MSPPAASPLNDTATANGHVPSTFTDTGPGEVGAGWDGSTFGFDLPSPVHSLRGNVSMLDSSVFRTMFGSDKMRAIMSDRAYVERLVEVEVALAKVEGDLGIIPKEAAVAIGRYADASKINLERMRHEVSCLVNALQEVLKVVTLPGWADLFLQDRHRRLLDSPRYSSACRNVRCLGQIHSCRFQHPRHPRSGSFPANQGWSGPYREGAQCDKGYSCQTLQGVQVLSDDRP